MWGIEGCEVWGGEERVKNGVLERIGKEKVVGRDLWGRSVEYV